MGSKQVHAWISYWITQIASSCVGWCRCGTRVEEHVRFALLSLVHTAACERVLGAEKQEYACSHRSELLAKISAFGYCFCLSQGNPMKCNTETSLKRLPTCRSAL